MIGDNYFTADERTLLTLYLEDTKAQTEENISNMQKELTSSLPGFYRDHDTHDHLKCYSSSRFLRCRTRSAGNALLHYLQTLAA